MQKSDVNVLVVEDDSTQSEALVTAIEKLGYKALPCKKADDAESVARIKPIHGAIVDCMLPGKNGVDLVVKLKENIVEGAPVILVSGIYRDKSFQQDAIQRTDAVRFFPKPFDIEDVMKVIDKELGQFVEAPKVDLHALLAAPMASQRDRRKALDHVEEMYGYDIPFVLCILMESESSGHLNIVDDKQNIFGVTFAKGFLAKVDSETSKITTKNILTKHGFVTGKDLDELKNKKGSNLVRNLVEEGLLSPHVEGVVKAEQIVNELYQLVGSSRLDINFVPDRKVKPMDDDVNLEDLLPQLHDMVENLIPLEYLKEFYSTWNGHSIRLGPSYQDQIRILNLPIVERVKDVFDLLKQELTIDEVVSQSKHKEDDLYKAIHLLAIRRILVFDERKQVRNVDEHVNRLKQIHAKVKGRNPIEIFEYFGVPEGSKAADYVHVYREFAKSNHPDTLPQAVSNDIKKLNHELFASVTDAYEIMTDENKGQEYFTRVKQAEAERQLKSEELLAEAYTHISRGRFTDALPIVRKAIVLYESEKGNLYRIWCELKLEGEVEVAAEKVLDEMLLMEDSTKSLALYHFVHSLVLKKMGRLNDAYRNLVQCLKLDSNFMDARRELANYKTAAKSAKLDLNELLTGDLTDVFSKILKKKKGA